MLTRLKTHAGSGSAPRALVLTPTRELAAQVAQSFGDYGRHMSLRSEAVYGGVGMHDQIKALRRGIDILIATPGRLLDHVERRTVRLSGVEVLILDEGDRMLDMGFLPAIRRIIDLLPAERQNLLFSATFCPEVRRLSSTHGIDVEGLSHVVNFDMPNAAEDYIHRIGLTGRAGASGRAVSLVSGDEREQLQDMQRLLGRTLPASVVEGFEPRARPDTVANARPAGNRRPHRQPQGQKYHHAHRRDHGSEGHSQGFKPGRKAR